MPTVRSVPSRMRIILDNGAYSLRNMGDVATLQTTVDRLQKLVPNPHIAILTTQPDLLQKYCPGTQPLSVESRDAAYDPDDAPHSHLRQSWEQFKMRFRTPSPQAASFLHAFDAADAVFLAGGGFLNDINPYQTRPALRMLAHAARRRKKTAMFSQGLGPLHSPELLALLRRASASGVPMALRESISGPAILRRAGIPPASFSFTVTGDDALEMAWQRGPAHPAGALALGFSLRKVDYSELNSADLDLLAQTLRALSRQLSAPVLPLPISFNAHERDHDFIAQVAGLPPEPLLDSPLAIIDRAAHCRVVLTGTYHAAVFALALGIPCVCFYVSNYYRSKLEGLAYLFPGGCHVIDARSSDASQRLTSAVLNAWDIASPALTSTLRAHALPQINAGWSFYRQVLHLPASPAPAAPPT